MLFSVDELIAYVSKYFTLKTGDLIFTGTPAGVGQVHRDDLLELHLEGERIFYFNEIGRLNQQGGLSSF